ncbi:MAG: neocarzinostatin apoprotein domain-containing protein [Acidimicrobiales bacterium]
MRPAAFAVVLLTVIAGTGASARALDNRDDDPATVRLDVAFVPDDQRSEPLVVDGLAARTVLTLTATAFEPDTTGVIQLCVEDGTRSCHDELPVRFDGEGAAEFQYLVRFDAGSTPSGDRTCGSPSVRCTIEIEAASTTTVIDAVFFEEAPPPGRIEVTPADGLRPGDEVTVTASRFPPGATLSVTVCAAPSTSGVRCGAPGPVVPLTIGGDGSAAAGFTLDVDEVGRDRVACGRRTDCRLVVSSERPDVWAPPVLLALGDAPGADYDRSRLTLGLGAALALAMAAGWFILRGDWSPPGESDGSAIDDVAFADLDAEAARHEAAEATPPPPGDQTPTGAGR